MKTSYGILSPARYSNPGPTAHANQYTAALVSRNRNLGDFSFQYHIIALSDHKWIEI